jgi:rubrerythrin
MRRYAARRDFADEAAKGAPWKEAWICTTCGTQYAASEEPATWPFALRP